MSHHVNYGPEGTNAFTWRPSKPQLTQPARKPEKPRRHEQCDRCVAEAMFEVVISENPVARMLYFCGHHFTEHRISLFEHAYEVREM